jgi:hypothetical protein
MVDSKNNWGFQVDLYKKRPKLKHFQPVAGEKY